MTKKRIIILGAGLAGLSAAWHLQKKGIEAVVFEKEPEVGGLCRSKHVNGFTFDTDGHLLHFRHRYTWELVKRFLGHNLAEHTRKALVYTHGSYRPYPFQANLHGLPDSVIKECVEGFLAAQHNGKIRRGRDLNFLNWIHHTFGRGIARHFMVPYNAKFWTLPLRELTCEWLDGFIPVPSVKQVIAGARGVNRKNFGYNAKFWYPKKGGIAQLANAFARNLKHIKINTGVEEINLARKYIRTASGGRENFDCLISSLPLPEIPKLVKDMPRDIANDFKKLKWNSVFNLNLGINRIQDKEAHWIYYPMKEFCFFRVGFPHNFSVGITPEGKSALYVEVSYSKARPLDKQGIQRRIREHLVKSGLIQQNDRFCVQDINDIHYGYPVYDFNYHSAREKILGFFHSNRILSCGRYGLWKYMSMEDAILSGKEAAEKAGIL